jgi:uncharacterized protein YqgV (UPF0045/DUF77 family)
MEKVVSEKGETMASDDFRTYPMTTCVYAVGEYVEEQKLTFQPGCYGTCVRHETDEKENIVKLRELLEAYDRELANLKKDFKIKELEDKAKVCDYLIKFTEEGSKIDSRNDMIAWISAHNSYRKILDQNFNKECVVLQEKYLDEIKLLLLELES